MRSCPHHEDRTPSVGVFQDGSTYCYSCHATTPALLRSPHPDWLVTSQQTLDRALSEDILWRVIEFQANLYPFRWAPVLYLRGEQVFIHADGFRTAPEAVAWADAQDFSYLVPKTRFEREMLL